MLVLEFINLCFFLQDLAKGIFKEFQLFTFFLKTIFSSIFTVPPY